jgi:hypothetical protein
MLAVDWHRIMLIHRGFGGNYMKALERKVLKERIMNLAQEQFGDLLKDIRFSGPFEDEDLDVDIILRQKIELNEIGKKLWNIRKPIRE